MLHAIPSSDLHISLHLSSLSGHPSSSFNIACRGKRDLILAGAMGIADPIVTNMPTNISTFCGKREKEVEFFNSLQKAAKFLSKNQKLGRKYLEQTWGWDRLGVFKKKKLMTLLLKIKKANLSHPPVCIKYKMVKLWGVCPLCLIAHVIVSLVALKEKHVPTASWPS